MLFGQGVTARYEFGDGKSLKKIKMLHFEGENEVLYEVSLTY